MADSDVPASGHPLLLPKKSSGSGKTKVWWTMQHCLDIAQEIYDDLPDDVHMLLAKGPFKGRIVTVDEELGNVSAEDVTANKAFLKAILRHHPTKVPSKYLIADIILCLDFLVHGALLTPKGHETKKDLGEGEGVKLKKLLGKCRELAKLTDGSPYPEVAELKAIVVNKRKSPCKTPVADAEDDDGLLDMVMELIDTMDEFSASTFLAMIPTFENENEIASELIKFLGEDEDMGVMSPQVPKALSFSNDSPMFVIPLDDDLSTPPQVACLSVWKPSYVQGAFKEPCHGMPCLGMACDGMPWHAMAWYPPWDGMPWDAMPSPHPPKPHSPPASPPNPPPSPPNTLERFADSIGFIG